MNPGMPNIPTISIVVQLIPTDHPMGDKIKFNTKNPTKPPNPCRIALKISFKGFGKIIKVKIITPAIIKKIKIPLPSIVSPLNNRYYEVCSHSFNKDISFSLAFFK